MKSPYRINRKKRKAVAMNKRRLWEQFDKMILGLLAAERLRIAFPDGTSVPFTARISTSRISDNVSDRITTSPITGRSNLQ
jgi:hypothetical protein